MGETDLIRHLRRIERHLAEERRHRSTLLEQKTDNALKTLRFVFLIGGIAITGIGYALQSNLQVTTIIGEEYLVSALAFYLASLFSAFLSVIPHTYFREIKKEVPEIATDPENTEKGLEALTRRITIQIEGLEALDYYDFNKALLILISQAFLIISLMILVGALLPDVLGLWSLLVLLLSILFVLPVAWIAKKPERAYNIGKERLLDS